MKGAESIIFSHKLFNPNFWHLREAKQNPNIRTILLQGGSSSAKSVSNAQDIVLDAFERGESTLVLRKVGTSIKYSVYEEFKIWIYAFRLKECFTFNMNSIKCHINNSKIDFSGLDDPEKIKSITNYKRIVLEEATEFAHEDFKQISLRLRGKSGLQIILLYNPVSEDHWIKKEIIDKQEWEDVSTSLPGGVKNVFTGDYLTDEYTSVTRKMINKPRLIFNERKGNYEEAASDMIFIQSTYKNNFWVFGSPCGTYGYYDRQTIINYTRLKDNDQAYYMVYAEGNWGTIKTGGEFWGSFEPSRHKAKYPYIPDLPVHISIDNNVLPYISVSFWQIQPTEYGHQIRQFHEIPAAEPFNTVTKAAEMVRLYLEELKYKDVVYLYGDASTKNGSTIDEHKRSFLDKFIEEVEKTYYVELRMPQGNPSVSMTGEFINAIYAGVVPTLSIGIDEGCKTSISDYILVKKDVNGGVLKVRTKDKVTGQSYEKNGHFTDTKRYFITEAFKKEYTAFSLRRKHNKTKEDDMKYYDTSKVKRDGARELVEIHSGVNGWFIALRAFVKDNNVYLDKVIMSRDVPNLDKVHKFAKGTDIAVEVSDGMRAYLREFREYNEDVFVFGRKQKPDPHSRIQANTSYIKEHFYYPDLDDSFEGFINNVLDYREKDSYEAMYVLSCLAERVRKDSEN